MASPYLIPFKAEHLIKFVNRDGNQFSGVKDALFRESEGIAFTAMVEDRIIGCAGVTIVWAHVGLAWAAISPEAGNYMFWTTKMVRQVLKDAIRIYDLHRVELISLLENERNQRWAEFLGFKMEDGIAHKYTSGGHNIVRYEWVKKDG